MAVLKIKQKKKDFYETSSLIGAQDTPIDLDNHNKIYSPTANASPDVSLTFTGTQDTPVIKSSISCDKKKNRTPLISCNQKEVDEIRANMMALKSFLMNEIFDLRQEITSLQLQLQQEKLKTNSCENEEKIVIENLKSQITSYKAENTFLKEEMKSKQNIFDEILHQNSQLLKFEHYFNNTTNKKENIREDKECHNKLNHQQKNQLSKEKTVLSNESEKSENKMHGNDQKKVFIIGVIFSIIQRYDQDYNEEIQSINDKLQRFCTSKGLSFIKNNNIDKSCLNKGKLHLNRRGSSFLANNFKKFVNAL